MGIIDNAKEIADLIKKLNNIELYRKIVELEAEIIDLQRAKNDLDLKVTGLQAALQQKKSMSFKHPFYFAEGDPIPFCAKCWEAEHNAIHLVGPDQHGDRYCRNCKTCYGRDGGV